MSVSKGHRKQARNWHCNTQLTYRTNMSETASNVVLQCPSHDSHYTSIYMVGIKRMRDWGVCKICHDYGLLATISMDRGGWGCVYKGVTGVSIAAQCHAPEGPVHLDRRGDGGLAHCKQKMEGNSSFTCCPDAPPINLLLWSAPVWYPAPPSVSMKTREGASKCLIYRHLPCPNE